MLTHIIGQQAKLELVNGLTRLTCDAVEMHPNQHGTTDVITLRPLCAALAIFNTSDLFGFAMKLFNLPTQATLFLGSLGRILSDVIGYDIVRALGRQHKPEEFHSMAFGKVFEMDEFALLWLSCRPTQLVNPPMSLLTIAIIYIAIRFDGTVVNLLQLLDQTHDLAGSVPSIHQNGTKG